MDDLLQPEPTAALPKSGKAATAEIYAEWAIWLCENRRTRFKTRISGPLAEILKKYPDDYKLRLLSAKEPRHVDAAATD